MAPEQGFAVSPMDCPNPALTGVPRKEEKSRVNTRFSRSSGSFSC